MKALRLEAILLFACITAAGCGGGSVTAPPLQSQQPNPRPAATATPAPAATATPAATPAAPPASIATSIPLGAALTNAPLNTAVPAPAGYAQTIAFPLVNTAANTTLALSAGPGLPAGLIALSSGRAPLARVRPQTSSNYTTVFYDSITPSANITVAGSLTFTQSFPNGGLVAGSPYYLAYYDTTQAMPAWQTISGPVMPAGGNLTFSGAITPLTLLANKQYGFATFTYLVPTATPPPTPQTLLYFGNSTTLTIATESGTVVNTLAIPSQSFDLDDAGNIYAFNFQGTPSLAKYAPGSSAPSLTYTPTLPSRAFVAVSGAGEMAAIHVLNNKSNGILTTDVWDPGKSGTPSRTLQTLVSGSNFAYVMTHDGTLYLPDHTSTGQPRYDIFPPGASTPSGSILETIVPPSQYANFSPSYAAVGLDGTLYVTEYTYGQPDPSAGTYIYTATAEGFIPAATNANGPGPQGVDVDASGNIYVVNNNIAILTNSTCQTDSLHSITEYTPRGALERTVNVPQNPFPLTVAADGTAFFSTFNTTLQNGCNLTGANGIYRLDPGATAAAQIATTGSTQIILFDGTHKTVPSSTGSHSSGGAHGGGRGSFAQRSIPGN